MCRNLVKVTELQQRIAGHHQTLKDSRAVPEGFTKWDRTVLTGNHKTIPAIVAELEALTGKIVNSLNIGPHALFAVEFERPFEQVATGLARRLLDPKCPAFLREQAYRVYQAHVAGRSNNAKYVSSTMAQAAAAVGVLSYPRRFLELHVSLVDDRGLEWDCPAVHFDFGSLISNDKAQDVAVAGAAKKVAPSKLTAGALQRVRKELTRLAKNPPDGCSLVVGPSGDPSKCVATILGPVGTPYEGGIFTFDYIFPENYPGAPPKLRCATKIFHCNVNETGEMCGIPQLKDAWTPALTPNDILNAVISLLLSPNYDEPLMADIAGLYKKDKKSHDTQAADTTKRFATYNSDASIDWSKVKIDANLVSASSQATEQKGSSVEAKQRPAEEIEKILRSTKFDWTVTSWKILDIDRHRRYCSQFPELSTGTAVSVSTEDPAEEKIVRIDGDKATEMLKEDVILLSDLTPSELVEYKFAGGDWMTSCIGVDSLENYRSSKFGLWKHMALNIWKDCLSSFIRVLKGGPICHMFDDKMFPEAPGDEKAWQVVDAAGKIRRVAHPVEAMRIYRPATKSYEVVDTRLGGAPLDDQVASFWTSLLQEIRAVTAPQVGVDFLDDAQTLDEATWKAKYS
jgi:ubiquitin-conjugating enzyme E2 D/E